jgi:hypothetical protein
MIGTTRPSPKIHAAQRYITSVNAPSERCETRVEAVKPNGGKPDFFNGETQMSLFILPVSGWNGAGLLEGRAGVQGK